MTKMKRSNEIRAVIAVTAISMGIAWQIAGAIGIDPWAGVTAELAVLLGASWERYYGLLRIIEDQKRTIQGQKLFQQQLQMQQSHPIQNPYARAYTEQMSRKAL